MLTKLRNVITQPRTKRDWVKVFAYGAVATALLCLTIVTSMLLLKKAPYEFSAEQLTVDYLQEKTEIAGVKVVPDLSGFIQQDVAYINYYSDDGILEEDELASGVLVSEDVLVYDQLLTQFKSSTPGCDYNSQKVRGDQEYLEAICLESSFELYAFKRPTGGIIVFNSNVGSGELENILRNY